MTTLTATDKASTSRYHINGRGVPGVTDILRETIGGWMPADDWYLERGTALHACMEMIAKGKTFECDPQIEGYVQAGRNFFTDVQPEILDTEVEVLSKLYQYGGRYDARARINGRSCIIDWKTNAYDLETVTLQLGGYALAQGKTRWGMAVALHEDGTYKTSGFLDLTLAQREFIALRTVYGIKDRMGRITKRRRKE